jgi:hypothetical protein
VDGLDEVLWMVVLVHFGGLGDRCILMVYIVWLTLIVDMTWLLWLTRLIVSYLSDRYLFDDARVTIDAI